MLKLKAAKALRPGNGRRAWEKHMKKEAAEEKHGFDLAVGEGSA